jgi:hypothetical protein
MTEVRSDSCPICEGPLPDRPSGPGRPRTYCSVRCRMQNQRRRYRAQVDAEEQARREAYRREWAHAPKSRFSGGWGN